MRFFCTCDCRKTRDDLEETTSQLKRLKADHADLYDRFLRLQGRLAARVKLEASEPGGAPTGDLAAPVQRGNPDAIRLLEKRRAHVSG